MNETRIQPLRAGATIGYHLLPGVAILVAIVLITPVVREAGWPAATGIWLAALLVLVPLQLGILYLLGKKRNGRFSLEGVVLNREKTPLPQFSLLVVVIFTLSVLTFLVLRPVDSKLQNLFSWLPEWFFMNEDLSVYSTGVQLINWLGIFFVTCILAPYVEELYFRGFLLPRMAWMKPWAPVVGAFLFSLYHFWSPWQFVTRFLAVLPLVYLVNWKKDLRIGVVSHWILNTLGSIGLLISIFK